jgi:hypothetical protein
MFSHKPRKKEAKKSEVHKMRNKFLLLSMILVVLAVILVSIIPAMAAEKTPFTCVETVLGLADPGEVKVLPNGSRHIRGALLLADEWADDPRLVGKNYIDYNANLNTDLSGPMWGTFRIETAGNEGSGWEGTYAGRREEFYNAVADGFGDYTGMKIWWNKSGDDCSGAIREN